MDDRAVDGVNSKTIMMIKLIQEQWFLPFVNYRADAATSTGLADITAITFIDPPKATQRGRQESRANGCSLH